jgi:DhnA family fructose-bisphosphate aldolase class Ia
LARQHDGQAPAIAVRQNLSGHQHEGPDIESFAALDFAGLQTLIIRGGKRAEDERKLKECRYEAFLIGGIRWMVSNRSIEQ